METTILQYINPDFIKFALVLVFSLLIGLEQRRHHIDMEAEELFGTDRTFTLIGVLGYLLYIISPNNLSPFLGGGAVVTLFLAIFYYQKIQIKKKFGLTSIIIALITYCLAPLIYTQPLWLVLLLIVCVLIITEIKGELSAFSHKVDDSEFITLGKFIVLAGVILPLLPNTPISPLINVSPYKCWLAIVVVSGISYLSYLLKKFVFPQAGILLTGILGGLYSSTATTVILARKSKEQPTDSRIVPAIFLAITMMYLRLFLLAFIFNQPIAFLLLPYFVVFILVTVGLALYFIKAYKATNDDTKNPDQTVAPHSNPLEFKTSLLFGGLFIVFAVITGFVSEKYGGTGVNILAFLVGVTDIDPFIMNLFQSKLPIANAIITMAVLNAITSNNILKMVYALSFSEKSLRKRLIVGFAILIGVGVIGSVLMAFL